MKVGIVVDDYKLSKFKKALNEKEILFTDKPFSQGVTAIFLFIEPSQLNDIYKMCKELEINIKQSN